MPTTTLDPSFLAPTRIILFGKVFSGLSVNTVSSAAPSAAASSIAATLTGLSGGAQVARIFSFSYEGQYQKLPWPMLFVVSGPGTALPATPAIDDAGLEAQDWDFASDILAWPVDKADNAICLDLLIGRFDDVLLGQVALAQDDATARSALASRSAATSRSAAVFRSAATFRSAMIGPHQDR